MDNDKSRSVNDRIEIEFTSDVSAYSRETIEHCIANTATDEGLWVYRSPSKETSGTIRYEITAHDRTTFDLTDGQVIERLRVMAQRDGISLKDMLRRLASDES